MSKRYRVLRPKIEKTDGSAAYYQGEEGELPEYSKSTLRRWVAQGVIEIIEEDDEEEVESDDWTND